MQQVLFGAGSGSSSITLYGKVFSYNSFSAESGASVIIPINCTISKIRAYLSAAPGASTSYDVTAYVNGSPSALTVNILGSNTSGSDLVNTLSLSAGDLLSVAIIPNSSPTLSTLAFSVVLSAGVSEAVVISSSPTTVASSGLFPLMGDRAAIHATLNRAIMPTAGTFSDLYFSLGAAPTAGKSKTATLRVNGVASALTTTVADAATSNSDLVNTVAVVAGDIVEYEFTNAGAPANSTVNCSMQFSPTVDGESIYLCDDGSSSFNTGSVRYGRMVGTVSPSSAETDVDVPTDNVVLKKLYVGVNTAPGVGKSWVVALRRASVATTSVVVTISGTDTSGNDIVDSHSTLINLMNVIMTPSGTPDATTGRYSYVSTLSATVPVSKLPLLGVC